MKVKIIVSSIALSVLCGCSSVKVKKDASGVTATINCPISGKDTCVEIQIDQETLDQAAEGAKLYFVK